MELDELKQSWQALDRRMAQQHALTLQLQRESRLEKMRHGLRPLWVGQIVQIVAGALLSLVAGNFWFEHRQYPHLLFCGVLVHLYGVLMIVFAARNLHLVKQIDYAAPVLDIQRRLAELRAWKTRVEAPVFLVTGCFVWIPALLMLFAGLGADVWKLHPDVVLWLCASGVASVLLVWLGMQAIKRIWGARVLEREAAGYSVRRAEAVLDEVRRFQEGD